MADVTLLLQEIAEGKTSATEALWEAVYQELRTLAAQKLARERPGQTLQATALVHEAYLRVAPQQSRFDGRAHFFKAAAEAMRRILIEKARKKARIRHGGDLQRVDLESVTVAVNDNDETVLGIHEALDRLAQEAPEKAEVVKLRYFAGLKNEEIAEILGISLATVKRHWSYSRSWLYLELERINQETPVQGE